MEMTSVVLGTHFENFIRTKISQGQYSNASEVICAGLSLLEDNEKQAIALNLQELMPLQRFLKKLDVAYSYIDQDKVETDGIQSQSTLEYLRHKLVCNLQMHLWRQLNLSLNYRFQERTGGYTDTSGIVHDYKPYGIIDARLGWNANTYNIYVEANNLLNKTYVDFGNIPQPGTWVMVGISINNIYRKQR